jgi:hypothetical protein
VKRTNGKWTPEKQALAAALLDLGKTHAEIARHPKIASTTGAVGTALGRFGITGKRPPPIRLPVKSAKKLAPAAIARGKTTAEIACDLIAILGADPALLDNVLDDGVFTNDLS